MATSTIVVMVLFIGAILALLLAVIWGLWRIDSEPEQKKGNKVNELQELRSKVSTLELKIEQFERTRELDQIFCMGQITDKQKIDAILHYLGLEVVNEPSKIKVVKNGK